METIIDTLAPNAALRAVDNIQQDPKVLFTTLNAIRAKSPCASGWEKLLKYLGKTQADDVPVPFSVILQSNGLDDALWCCRAAPQYDREWRLFAIWCAQQVLPLMNDERSRNALIVAERFANGLATEQERDAARDTARDAAWAAARDTAWAAARDAAWAAAWDTAWDTARDAQKEVFIWIVTGQLAEFERMPA